MMNNEIYYLTYTSTISFWGAINPFTFKNIEKISLQRNQSKQITRFLMFKQGRFFQYLEGDEAQLTRLYQKLLKDKRHKNLKMIVDGHCEQKLFKKWDMYCFDLNSHNQNLSIKDLFEPSKCYE